MVEEVATLEPPALQAVEEWQWSAVLPEVLLAVTKGEYLPPSEVTSGLACPAPD